MPYASLVPVAGYLVAQPSSAPYSIPQPSGWGKESIKLPAPFAPKMTWKGAEELRFAPKWLQPDSENFFSYTLFFWLDADQKLDKATCEKELHAYYEGLATAVLRRKKQEGSVSTAVS